MHYSCLRRCRNSPASQHFSYNERSLQKKKQHQKSEADTHSGVGLLQSMGPSELRGILGCSLLGRTERGGKFMSFVCLIRVNFRKLTFTKPDFRGNISPIGSDNPNSDIKPEEVSK